MRFRHLWGARDTGDILATYCAPYVTNRKLDLDELAELVDAATSDGIRRFNSAGGAQLWCDRLRKPNQ